jgi:hypothetical protein
MHRMHPAKLSHGALHMPFFLFPTLQVCFRLSLLLENSLADKHLIQKSNGLVFLFPLTGMAI